MQRGVEGRLSIVRLWSYQKGTQVGTQVKKGLKKGLKNGLKSKKDSMQVRVMVVGFSHQGKGV